MNLSSKLIETAVNELSRLPGIGKKTALRLALHLLKQPLETSVNLAESLRQMRELTTYCRTCFNVSDGPQCSICATPSRMRGPVCVVETIKDVMAIESTGQYNGSYHVLGGVISPLDGIGPDALHIKPLLDRVQAGGVEEIIFALNPNIQGDTTMYYIQKQLANAPVKFTTIARGISFGGELEYADEFTLARSLQNRQPVDTYI